MDSRGGAYSDSQWCSNLFEVQQDPSGSSALCSQRGAEDGPLRSGLKSTKLYSKMFHGSGNGPQGWVLPVQGVKAGDGWFYTRSSLRNSLFTLESDSLSSLLCSAGLVYGFTRPLGLLSALPSVEFVSSMDGFPSGRQNLRVSCDNVWFQDFRLRCCQDLLGVSETSPISFPPVFLSGLGRQFPPRWALQRLSFSYCARQDHSPNSFFGIQDLVAQVLSDPFHSEGLSRLRDRLYGGETSPHGKACHKDHLLHRRDDCTPCLGGGSVCSDAGCGSGHAYIGSSCSRGGQGLETSALSLAYEETEVGLGPFGGVSRPHDGYTGFPLAQCQVQSGSSLSSTRRSPGHGDRCVEVKQLHGLGSGRGVCVRGRYATYSGDEREMGKRKKKGN